MNMIGHSADGREFDSDILADSCDVGPELFAFFYRDGWRALLRAEYAMNEIDRVCVGHGGAPTGLGRPANPTQRLRAGLTNCAPSGLAFRRDLESDIGPQQSLCRSSHRVRWKNYRRNGTDQDI